MKYIVNNLLAVIIVVLVVIVLLQRCDSDPVAPVEPKIIRDTIWTTKDSIIYSSPKVIKTIPVKVIDKQYLPDPNYDKLVLQYQELLNNYLAKNIQKDSIKIDSIGFVKVTDTVQNNIVKNRKWEYDLKYPTIKETIVMPPKQVNQLYLGGGIKGNQVSLVNSLDLGLLYKNKKDQIYGISVGINTLGQIQYGVQSYWKIKFK